MSSFAFLVFVCLQICFIQTVFTQCTGYGGVGYGNGVVGGMGYGNGLAYGNSGLAAGYNSLGYPNGLAAPGLNPTAAAGAYGGVGNGDLRVSGELPVAGTAIVGGQVPISGAVEFGGSIPAGGVITISGSCGCGNKPYYL